MFYGTSGAARIPRKLRRCGRSIFQILCGYFPWAGESSFPLVCTDNSQFLEMLPFFDDKWKVHIVKG